MITDYQNDGPRAGPDRTVRASFGAVHEIDSFSPTSSVVASTALTVCSPYDLWGGLRRTAAAKTRDRTSQPFAARRSRQ